jgi:CxxC motif-containing protein (DUF1111 family)
MKRFSSAVIVLLAVVSIFLGTQHANRRNAKRVNHDSQEAAGGLDNITIETDTDPNNQQHTADRQVFEAVEEVTPDGLGPIYNAQSCRECHQNGGERFPSSGNQLSAISGGPSQTVEERAGHLDREGKFEAPDVPIEGDVIRDRTLINDRSICLEAQERVPVTETIRTNRLALTLLGDGFVEAVPDETLLDIRNRQCRYGDKRVCGVAIRVPVLESPPLMRVGRFGWKDQHASLLSFAGDAYINEMGITNKLFPQEFTQVCNPSVSNVKPPANPVPGTVTEPNDQPVPSDNLEDIDHFARFIRATKAPPRDKSADAPATKEAVIRGEKIFNEVGCARCHIAEMQTAPVGTRLNGGTFVVTKALGNKIFHPYSDFLLHDVGTGDGIAIAPVEHYGRPVTRQMNEHDASSMGMPPNQPIDPLARSAYERQIAAAPFVPKNRYYSKSSCDSHRLAEEQSSSPASYFDDFQCSANKIRTPALWGLHMRSRLMHDGQSLQLREAIERHQGEAKEVTRQFFKRNERDIANVLLFLNSL